MRILGVLRNNFHNMGICRRQEQNFFLTLVIHAGVLMALLICSATAFFSILLEDYSLGVKFGSFYVTTSGLLLAILYLHAAWKKTDLLNLIDDLEKVVQESKILSFWNSHFSHKYLNISGMKNPEIAKNLEQLNQRMNKFNSIAYIFSVSVNFGLSCFFPVYEILKQDYL